MVTRLKFIGAGSIKRCCDSLEKKLVEVHNNEHHQAEQSGDGVCPDNGGRYSGNYRQWRRITGLQ
jgi:hypothetical protein